MGEAFVGILNGDWIAVMNTVKTVFSGETFILLAEDGNAEAPPQFRPAKSLEQSLEMPRGRAFNKEAEVRWRIRSKNRFNIIFLSEKLQPPAGFELSKVRWATSDQVQKLYGKWSSTAKEWVEVSVPGVKGSYKELFDSHESQPPLRLEVVDYSSDGCIQMTRFSKVVKDERY
jgi:hypothetical protein